MSIASWLKALVPNDGRPFRAVIVLAASSGIALAQPMIRAPDAADALAVVAHVDVLPDHANETRDAIAAYAEAARREPGALRVDAMQEVRQNHFDIVETWRDEAAYRAHQASAATLRLRRTIGPWLGSPLDERVGTPLPRDKGIRSITLKPLIARRR